MSARRSFLFALFCLVVTLSPVVRADDARAAALAQKDLKAGVEAYKKGDYEGARIFFQRSFAVRPTGDALRRLAQAELRTQRPLDAVQHFRLYGKDRNADRDFVANDLPRYLEECDRQLGHLRITAPAGAVVTVDGRRAPEPVDEKIDVLAGEHTVAIRGRDESAQRVVAPAGQVVDVVFPDESRPASVTPTSAPTATSSALPTTGPSAATLPQQKEGPRGFHRAPPVASWILFGGGAVAAGAGVLFAIEANAKKDDYLRDPNACAVHTSAACAAANDSLDAAHLNTALSITGYSLAGVAVATGVLVWALSPSEKAPRVSGMMAPGLAGVHVQGAF